jgi:hypothetical protein
MVAVYVLAVISVLFGCILIILVGVSWFQTKEKTLTDQRLVLTEAFPRDSTIQVMRRIEHPRLRPGMHNYNPSLFTHKGQRFVVHRLSNYNLCHNILKHVPDYLATKRRHGIINSIVIETPDGRFVLVDYPNDPVHPCPESYEDPRSILFREELVLVVSDSQNKGCQGVMTLLFLDPDHLLEGDGGVKMVRPSRILRLHLTNKKERHVEKNWMPFVHEHSLCFVYSISPHIILRCNTENGECTKVAETSSPGVPRYLRGGTPALLIHPDYYLAAGHARHAIAGMKFVYTTVFYTFESKPPFRVLALSQEFFIDNDFDTHSFKQLVQFASGLDFDSRTQRLFLSYGSNDCSSRIVSVSLSSVKSLLRRV